MKKEPKRAFLPSQEHNEAQTHREGEQTGARRLAIALHTCVRTPETDVHLSLPVPVDNPSRAHLSCLRLGR